MSSPSARRTSNSNDGGRVLLKKALHDAMDRLGQAGVDSPRLTAQLLLAHILGCGRADLAARDDQSLSEELVRRFEDTLRRRESGEPLQHILGETDFWSLKIACDRRALVPRPETETLVEEALKVIAGNPSPRIADIGTGTACIAIALAHERPDARIVAVDIDADALALAESNVRRHNLGRQIELVQGDLAGPLCARKECGAFDLIVSNPPYVAEAEIAGLQREVRDYDPQRALNGGRDGLDLIRRLIIETPPLLRDCGFLVMEVGTGQAEQVREIIRSCEDWGAARTIRDAFGVERVVVARKVKKPCSRLKSKEE